MCVCLYARFYIPFRTIFIYFFLRCHNTIHNTVDTIPTHTQIVSTQQSIPFPRNELRSVNCTAHVETPSYHHDVKVAYMILCACAKVRGNSIFYSIWTEIYSRSIDCVAVKAAFLKMSLKFRSSYLLLSLGLATLAKHKIIVADDKVQYPRCDSSSEGKGQWDSRAVNIKKNLLNIYWIVVNIIIIGSLRCP